MTPYKILDFAPLGNGRLHQNEFLEALKASMEENGMTFDSRELQDLTRLVGYDLGHLGETRN